MLYSYAMSRFRHHVTSQQLIPSRRVLANPPATWGVEEPEKAQNMWNDKSVRGEGVAKPGMRVVLLPLTLHPEKGKTVANPTYAINAAFWLANAINEV